MMTINKPAWTVALYVIATLFCTFIIPWYMIILLSAIIAFISDVQSTVKTSVAFTIPSMIWSVMVLVKDEMHYVSVGNMIGSIIGDIPKGYIYVLTGLLIGVVSTLSAIAGNYFRKHYVTKNTTAIS